MNVSYFESKQDCSNCLGRVLLANYHSQLSFPYPFAVKMGAISYPLGNDKKHQEREGKKKTNTTFVRLLFPFWMSSCVKRQITTFLLKMTNKMAAFRR